jgi:hypothetical protein
LHEEFFADRSIFAIFHISGQLSDWLVGWLVGWLVTCLIIGHDFISSTHIKLQGITLSPLIKVLRPSLLDLLDRR